MWAGYLRPLPVRSMFESRGKFWLGWCPEKVDAVEPDFNKSIRAQSWLPWESPGKYTHNTHAHGHVHNHAHTLQTSRPLQPECLAAGPGYQYFLKLWGFKGGPVWPGLRTMVLSPHKTSTLNFTELQLCFRSDWMKSLGITCATSNLHTFDDGFSIAMGHLCNSKNQ